MHEGRRDYNLFWDELRNKHTDLKTFFRDAENSLAAEKKQKEEDKIALENDKKKSLEEKDQQFKQQKRDELEQSKSKLRHSELIPILCDGKQILILKENLTRENCPVNMLSQMIDGSKDFEIENGFLKLDMDPDVFETIVDYLTNNDNFEMPESAEELRKLSTAACKLEVNALIEDCKKQEILASIPKPDVFTFSSLSDAEQLLNTSSKPVVNLSVNLNSHNSSLTSVTITEHYNVFFSLGRLLRTKFTFIFAPDHHDGVFWNFYQKGEKVFSLPFHDMDPENQECDKVTVFNPSQGSRQRNSTRTIPEVFLSVFSEMKLKEKEKKRFYDLTWWEQTLVNDRPGSRRSSIANS